MRVRGRFVAAVVAMGCGLTLGVLPAYAGDGAVTDGAPIEAAGRPAPADPGIIIDVDPELGNRRAHLIFYTYNDLLGRDPDLSGLSGWQIAMFQGAPRSAVAMGITYSVEYREHLVAAAYRRYLERDPDRAGLNGWVAAMDRGWTVARIGAGFIASDEYYARAGGTRDGWIRALYDDVLDRDPSADEVAAWGRALARGSTREDVSLGFLLSTEHLATVVDGYYMTLLRRHPDAVGLRGWIALLQAGHHDEEIVAGIVASDEYWNLTAVFPLDTLLVTPDDAEVDPGTPVTFAVQGMGKWDDLGDMTARATFSLDGVPCEGSTCSTTTAGTHVVTAAVGDLWTAVDVVVRRGPLHRVEVTPDGRAIADGASVVYTAQGFDAYGNPYGDVTGQVTFAVDGDAAACTGARCRPTTPGDHVVSAVGLAGEATVSVSPPGPEGYALWGWGYTNLGISNQETVVLQPTMIGDSVRWSTVTMTAGVRTDGSLWSWGSDPCAAVRGGEWWRPEQIGYDMNWVAVADGGGLRVALKADGSLWGWGRLSTANTPWQPPTCELRPLTPGRTWRSITTGVFAVAAIDSAGGLWMWGENRGQLGDGTRVSRPDPTFIDAGPWRAVASSSRHTLAVREDGTLWAWGDNRNGRLGDGTRVTSLVPIQVGTDTDWVGVAVSSYRSVALKSDGTIWGWGGVTALEVGRPEDVLAPVLFDSSRQWTTVFGVSGAFFALAADGSLWGWGPNGSGQLGDGTTTTQAAPVQVGSGGGWADVSPFLSTTLALRDPAAAP